MAAPTAAFGSDSRFLNAWIRGGAATDRHNKRKLALFRFGRKSAKHTCETTSRVFPKLSERLLHPRTDRAERRLALFADGDDVVLSQQRKLDRDHHFFCLVSRERKKKHESLRRPMTDRNSNAVVNATDFMFEPIRNDKRTTGGERPLVVRPFRHRNFTIPVSTD